MREIEVKAALRDKPLFLQKATEKGIVFGDPVIQDDVTYESTISYDDPRWNIFRIRKQGGKVILTMKYKASSRSRDNHERETFIEDADQVADMLERVGYHLSVRLRKSRQVAHYQGLELCFDEIEGLGSFVEVEKLVDEDVDVDIIQSQLWKLLVDLGIHPKDRIHKGYDTLMKERAKSKL